MFRRPKGKDYEWVSFTVSFWEGEYKDAEAQTSQKVTRRELRKVPRFDEELLFIKKKKERAEKPAYQLHLYQRKKTKDYEEEG